MREEGKNGERREAGARFELIIQYLQDLSSTL